MTCGNFVLKSSFVVLVLCYVAIYKSFFTELPVVNGDDNADASPEPGKE
jgi:hypothetical protein